MDHNFYKVWYQHSKQVWWVNMHTFVANFLRYVTSKNYLNLIIFSQVFAKVKGWRFFETQCTYKTNVMHFTLAFLISLLPSVTFSTFRSSQHTEPNTERKNWGITQWHWLSSRHGLHRDKARKHWVMGNRTVRLTAFYVLRFYGCF